MPSPLLAGIDHVAITVASIAVTSAFYDRLFGAEVLASHEREGVPAVTLIRVGGGVLLSVHQSGNGIDLVARHPGPGSADVCFTWTGSVAEAADHLARHGVEVIAGPAPRINAHGEPVQSVYFRDPDGNLLELMAKH